MRNKIRNADDADILVSEIGREDLGKLECRFRQIVEFQTAAPNRFAMLGRTLLGNAALRENMVSAQGCIGIETEPGGQQLVDVAALEGGAGFGLEMLLRIERELFDRHDQPFLKTSSNRVRCTRLSPRRRGSKEKVYMNMTVVVALPVFTRVQVGWAPASILTALSHEV